ncbi:hypothetical protein LTS14_001986 [Recurvomyces mirabilis]|nr:hypothetical protein LTS14_001986 [Recurvomyces mirabilis]
MSSGTTTSPIDPARFAMALESLPLDALHSKAAEIRNSILHLRHSNEQMMPFADEGDQDCKDAMFENLTVIGRMNMRVHLLKAEVERRGMIWVEDPSDLRQAPLEGDAVVVERQQDGAEGGVNGVGHANGALENGTTDSRSAARAPSGRLTDEELRRQIEAQMGVDADEEEEEDGVHL